MKHLLLLVCFAACGTPWADAPPVTDAGALAVADFFKHPVFRNAALSPSGKYVAVVNQPDDDHQYVSLIDLAGETSTDIVASADKREYFDSIRWVSDDTVTFIDHIGSGMQKL